MAFADGVIPSIGDVTKFLSTPPVTIWPSPLFAKSVNNKPDAGIVDALAALAGATVTTAEAPTEPVTYTGVPFVIVLPDVFLQATLT